MTEMMSVEAGAMALSETMYEVAHPLGDVPGLQEHPVAAAAAAMGFTAAIGTVAFAGRYATGDYAVQFNNQANNTGYSSVWPGWAYEVAKSALENGKKLFVGSNGDPFGSNLVYVLEFA
jgi:hypothetical protein